jgi:hypothetical protein
VGQWCRTTETGSTPTAPVQSATPADAERAAQQAEAACKARVAQVECELKLQRLEREEEERVEEKQRPQRKAEEKAQLRKERREARRAFWDRRRKVRQAKREEEGGQSGTGRVLLVLGLPAVLALYFYSRSQTGSGRIFTVGLLAAVAAFTVGALLGFLFGIPRSIAKKADAEKMSPDGKSAAEQAAAVAQHFTPNTNLEEISDWLTKILVGVGLVQIHQVSGAIEDLANGLAPSLGPASTGFPVAVTLLVSFSIIGFVSAYLYTRLRLQSAFELATAIKKAIMERADTETSALALVQEQLAPGTQSPTLDALTEALKTATSGIRTQAFFLARKQRLEDWGGEGNEEEKKEFTRLSIPVFEALIACDTEQSYHRSRAELGYAFMEQEPPDWAKAKAALDDAIKVRKPSEASSTPGYELNRAYCMIELASGASTDAVIEAICADLEAAIRGGGKLKRDKDKKLEKIKDWLRRNSESPTTEAQKRAAKLLPEVKKLTD